MQCLLSVMCSLILLCSFGMVSIPVSADTADDNASVNERIVEILSDF